MIKMTPLQNVQNCTSINFLIPLNITITHNDRESKIAAIYCTKFSTFRTKANSIYYIHLCLHHWETNLHIAMIYYICLFNSEVYLKQQRVVL